MFRVPVGNLHSRQYVDGLITDIAVIFVIANTRGVSRATLLNSQYRCAIRIWHCERFSLAFPHGAVMT